MKAIKAKCIGCYKSGRTEWSWTGSFRKVDEDLLEIIKNQTNHKGERCFIKIEVID